MVTDRGLIFSNAQAMTGSADEASTNVVDTEVAGSNVGGGTVMWVVCRVNTTYTCDTSGTLIVSLQNCATSDGTYANIAVSATYTVGTLAKGYDALTIPLPVDNLRYLRMYYDKGVGSGFTAGKMDAFLTPNAPRN